MHGNNHLVPMTSQILPPSGKTTSSNLFLRPTWPVPGGGKGAGLDIDRRITSKAPIKMAMC